MKTIADYLNDPRILNDPQMVGALEPIREIHAARLMIQDETAGMTIAERSAYHKKNITDLFAGLGLPPPQYVNMTGQGKLKPKTAIGV
jgi:hypothetical protein